MTPTEIHSELTVDPAGVGYASAVTAGNNNALAALLNATTGPGAATINIPWLTHDQFATMIAPAVMALGQASATIQSKWMPMVNLISGVQNVVLSSTILGMLQALVADGLLTAAEITAGTTRAGSRAEALWGAGTVVAPYDITVAMGRA